MHKRRQNLMSPVDTARRAPWDRGGSQSAVWWDHFGIKRWATRPRVQQRIPHLIPVWGTLIATGQLLGSIWSKLKAASHTKTHTCTNDWKCFQFNLDRNTTYNLNLCSNPHLKTHKTTPQALVSLWMSKAKSSHKAGLHGLKLHKSSSSNVTSCLTALFHAWWNVKRTVSKAFHIKCLLKCLSVILQCWHISAF